MKILVPRLLDACQRNPQNNNARNILGRWLLAGASITAFAYDLPEQAVQQNPRIKVVRLWRRHAWYLHILLTYLGKYDAIFYPGCHWTDTAGLRWRRRLRMNSPVIATLEGLVGTPEREEFYSKAAGHHVYCQRVDHATLARIDALLEDAHHVIAISPFLARMGCIRYGDKFSSIPLGVDLETYWSPKVRKSRARPVVVAAGRVYSHKRPDLFVNLASRFPEADFRWYGEGEDLKMYRTLARKRNLENLRFPGSLSASELSEAFREADVFVLPSYSEGVPKVTQEAAACGLPVVLFGFYESPSVIDEENGFVVWNDEELVTRLEQLLSDEALRRRLGCRGAAMAREWSWDLLASKWERKVLSVIENAH